MKHLLLGAIAGTIFGLTLAGGIFATAQTPQWYRDTLQGQYEQRMQLDELQHQQDLQQQEQHYQNLYKKPC